MMKRQFCLVCSLKIPNSRDRYCGATCFKIARRILSYNSLHKRSKVKIIIKSTPKGTDNIFYKMWSASKNNMAKSKNAKKAVKKVAKKAVKKGKR